MPLDAATAAAIAAQTAQSIVNTEHLRGNLIPAQPGTLTSIDASLARIGDALWVIADIAQNMSSTLYDLKVATEAQTSAMNDANTLQAIVVSSQVEANDFQRAVTEQSLTSSGQDIPKLPPLKDRMKIQVKSALDMVSVARVEGFVNQMFKDSLKNITLYAEGTEVYKTVAVKFEEAKKAILSVKIPSLENVKSKAASLLGSKAPPLYDV